MRGVVPYWQRSHAMDTPSVSCATRQGPRASEVRVTLRRAESFLVVRVVPRIPALEFFHPPGGIDQLLPAAPPRMTRGADGDAEMRDRRACGIGRATGAHNRCLTVRGMHSSLHGLLLQRCRPTLLVLYS